MDKNPAILDVDRLADLLGLSKWDDIYELNLDYIAEAGCDGRAEATKEGASEDDADNAASEAEERAADEIYTNWNRGVMAAADTLFDRHGLELVPVVRKGETGLPYRYRVKPKESWKDAAEHLRQTINGVGMFHYDSVKEFVHCASETVRGTVLTHLHWIKRHPHVYGDFSAERIYERVWRYGA